MKKIAAFFAFVMMNISALCLTVGAQDAASSGKKPMLEDVMKDYGVLIFCVVGGLFLLISLISMVSFFKSTKRKYLAGLNKNSTSTSEYSSKSNKSEKTEVSEKTEKSEKNIYLVINGNGQGPAQVQYLPVQQATSESPKEIPPVVAAVSTAAPEEKENKDQAAYYVPCYCDYCAYSAYDYSYCSACCYAYCKQERNEKLAKVQEEPVAEAAEETILEETPIAEAMPIEEEVTSVKDLEEEAIEPPVREFKDEGIKPEPLDPVIPVKPISPYDLMMPPTDCPKCKQARDLEAENKKKKKARNVAIAVAVAAVGATALKMAVKINCCKKRNRRRNYRR